MMIIASVIIKDIYYFNLKGAQWFVQIINGDKGNKKTAGSIFNSLFHDKTI